MDIRDEIRQYITAEMMNKPTYKLGDNDKLISGGLINSFSLAMLATFLDEKFGVNPDNSDLNADYMDSVAMIAAYVEAHRK